MLQRIGWEKLRQSRIIATLFSINVVIDYSCAVCTSWLLCETPTSHKTVIFISCEVIYIFVSLVPINAIVLKRCDMVLLSVLELRPFIFFCFAHDCRAAF